MFELIYPVDPAPILPLPTADDPGTKTLGNAEAVPVVEENGQKAVDYFTKALEALQDRKEFLYGAIALLAVTLGVVSLTRKREEVL